MLTQDEELWPKFLSESVRKLLSPEHDALADRGLYTAAPASASFAAKRVPDPFDPTRVVTFQVPHNAAVQVYDYKSKKSRYSVLLF